MATRLRAKIRQVAREIRRADKEVRKLRVQLRTGTLDRRKLESGLKELQRTLARVPPFHYDDPA